jgi:hypothetical protein
LLLQAYTCLTDVKVQDVMENCTNGQVEAVIHDVALADGPHQSEKYCHIEVSPTQHTAWYIVIKAEHAL